MIYTARRCPVIVEITISITLPYPLKWAIKAPNTAIATNVPYRCEVFIEEKLLSEYSIAETLITCAIISFIMISSLLQVKNHRLNQVKWISLDAYGTLFTFRNRVGVTYSHFGHKYTGVTIDERNMESSFIKAFKLHTWIPYDDQLNWEKIVYDSYINVGVDPSILNPQFKSLFTSLFKFYETKEAYSVYNDVFPFLEFCKEREFKIAIISNSDKRILTILKELGLPSEFVFNSMDPRIRKPNQTIFLNAQNEMVNVDPYLKSNQILHIGDDYINDYLGARNCQWKGLKLTRINQFT